MITTSFTTVATSVFTSMITTSFTTVATSVTSIPTSVSSSTSSSMAIAVAVRLGRWFPDLLLLLSRLIVAEVIKYASCVLVAVENFQNLPSFIREDLLSVSAVRHWLVFIVFQLNVAQLVVWNIFDINPLHLELSFPLVLSPDPSTAMVVHPVEHLRHTTEMPAAVHGEEEEHWTLALPFPPGRVQSFVAMLRAAPNLVFDTPMDIIFTIALYHKEARIFRAQIEIPGVVLVATSQLLKDRMAWCWGGFSPIKGGGP